MATTTHLAGGAVGNPAERSLRAALFERILFRIHRYFTRVVWDADAAEDCVQQTLLKLERSLQEGTYDPRRSFNRWMWLKAHTVFIEHCRAHAKKPLALPDEAVLGEDGLAEVQVDSKLDAEAVLTHLRANLESEDFEMFVLFFGERCTVTEISTITGRDRKTVRKRLDLAKRAATRLLEQTGPA